MLHKIIIILSCIVLLLNCKSSENQSFTNQESKMNFSIINELLDCNEFEIVKTFILKNGDRKTYRNIDNQNPHYQFENFEAFLGADLRINKNNDPEISDFNDLTIYNRNSEIRYFKFLIVRKGDIEDNKFWIREGMEEGQVYLLDTYNKGLAKMKVKVASYLDQIRKEIKAIELK